MLSSVVLSCLVLSSVVLGRLVLSYVALPRCVALYWVVLSCFVLSCLVFPSDRFKFSFCLSACLLFGERLFAFVMQQLCSHFGPDKARQDKAETAQHNITQRKTRPDLDKTTQCNTA